MHSFSRDCVTSRITGHMMTATNGDLDVSRLQSHLRPQEPVARLRARADGRRLFATRPPALRRAYDAIVRDWLSEAYACSPD